MTKRIGRCHICKQFFELRAGESVVPEHTGCAYKASEQPEGPISRRKAWKAAKTAGKVGPRSGRKPPPPTPKLPKQPPGTSASAVAAELGNKGTNWPQSKVTK